MKLWKSKPLVTRREAVERLRHIITMAVSHVTLLTKSITIGNISLPQEL